MTKKIKTPAKAARGLWMITSLSKSRDHKPCPFCRMMRLKGCPGPGKPHILASKSKRGIQLRIVKVR